MPDRRHHCALLTLLLPLLLGTSQANEEREAEQELESLSRELNALDQWVTETEKDRKQQQSELRRLDKRVQALEQGMRSSRSLLTEQQMGIVELEAESAAMNEQVRLQGEALARLGTSYQRLSGRRYAMLLFELESARQLDRVIRYTQIVRDAYLDRLADYAETLTNYGEVLRRLSEGVDREQSLQNEYATKHSELVAQRSSREEHIELLENKLLDQQQRRHELTQAATRIKDLLEQLRSRANLASGADISRHSGNLPWPAEGRLVHRFGSKRSQTSLTWQGIFIATDGRTEVRAVHGGTTIYQDWLNGFGNLMVVAHGNQHMSLYAQADSFYKSVNDPVEGGEVIGVTGASGGSRETGVYFEIRVNGQPQDPLRWLSD